MFLRDIQAKSGMVGNYAIIPRLLSDYSQFMPCACLAPLFRILCPNIRRTPTPNTRAVRAPRGNLKPSPLIILNDVIHQIQTGRGARLL